MYRRIAQVLQRGQIASQLRPVQFTIPRQVTFSARYGRSAILPVRSYATESPRGLPVTEDAYDEHAMTPEQRERASFHRLAQYSFSLIMLTLSEKKWKLIIPMKR
jgi:hypothetical protein